MRDRIQKRIFKAINRSRSFSRRYGDSIEDLGYSMEVGLSGEKNGDHTIEVMLQPLDNSHEPIPEDLFKKIRDVVLPQNYLGFEVNVKYSDKN